MSAQHAPHDDADGADPHDPYDIVPEGFCENWNADSIPEALANAEAAASTTDPAAQPRCPACLAARLTPLPSADGPAWECTECKARHDAALPPLRDARRQAAHAPDTDREAAQPRCRGCLSTRLYPVPERAPLAVRWACLECGERFETALPPVVVEKRGHVDAADLRLIQSLRRDDGQAGLDEVIGDA
jgi:hypothetical protein